MEEVRRQELDEAERRQLVMDLAQVPPGGRLLDLGTGTGDLALEGLGQLTNTISRVRAALHPGLRVRGLVMTMFDARASLSTQVVAEVEKHFPGKVFRAIIPRSVRLAEAPSHGLPISIYAPNSPGALAYRALAEELLAGDLPPAA